MPHTISREEVEEAKLLIASALCAQDSRKI
jgi:hypothetical protein